MADKFYKKLKLKYSNRTYIEIGGFGATEKRYPYPVESIQKEATVDGKEDNGYDGAK